AAPRTGAPPPRPLPLCRLPRRRRGGITVCFPPVPTAAVALQREVTRPRRFRAASRPWPHRFPGSAPRQAADGSTKTPRPRVDSGLARPPTAAHGPRDLHTSNGTRPDTQERRPGATEGRSAPWRPRPDFRSPWRARRRPARARPVSAARTLQKSVGLPPRPLSLAARGPPWPHDFPG